MSVIFQAQGFIIYETPDALSTILEHLQETTQMNAEYMWTDGYNEPIAPHTQTVFPEWNGLRIPQASVYRNLSVPDLLENVLWANVITSVASMSPNATIYHETGKVEEVDVFDAFDTHEEHDSRNNPNFTRQFVADTYHANADVHPPGAAKEYARFKNAISNAESLAELIETPL